MAGGSWSGTERARQRRRSAVRLEEIVSVDEPAFRTVFRLYERAFSEGEKESLYSIREALAGRLRGPDARDRFHVLAARGASGRIVGGAFFHYVAAINAGFLGYVFVRPSSQRQGIGRMLLRKVDAVLRRDARRLRRAAPVGFFFELKKPGKGAAPAEREFWRSAGVVLLDLDWQYPRLRRGAEPLDMWLAFRRRRKPRVVITRRYIARAVLALHRSVYGDSARSSAIRRRILASIRGTVAPWPN
jgi:GNAT superfamily N-acetyltransferase